jgi:SAM-dependent methyltransferase
MTAFNDEQRLYWNSDAGRAWVRRQERLDRQIAPHGERALAAAAPRTGERVLDVGCGCGATTLELARRVEARGFATGLDLSGPMLERARQRAAEAGLGNVEFRQDDAQTARPGEPVDLVFSRFGVMFFADPAAAFANLAAALRPGGRLAFVCWQGVMKNPWVTIPMGAVAAHLPLPAPPPPGTPGPFAFGDADRVRGILDEAGFGGIEIEGAEIPMSPGGGDLEDAVDLYLEIGPVAALLREHPDGAALAPKVADAIRSALAPLVRGDELALGSAAWIVTARRA